MPSGIGPPGDQLKSKRLPAWLIVLAFLLGASQPCSLLGPQEAPGGERSADYVQHDRRQLHARLWLYWTRHEYLHLCP